MCPGYESVSRSNGNGCGEGSSVNGFTLEQENMAHFHAQTLTLAAVTRSSRPDMTLEIRMCDVTELQANQLILFFEFENFIQTQFESNYTITRLDFSCYSEFQEQNSIIRQMSVTSDDQLLFVKLRVAVKVNVLMCI